MASNATASGTQVKARVAIIYSDGTVQSNESKNMGHFIGSCLANTGFAAVFMVAFSADGTADENIVSNQRKISFVPPGKTVAVTVPVRIIE
jgi:hypothetical protein